jgi:hypothetical protein
MKTVTTTPELLHATTESNSHLFDDWFDPIEAGVRDRVRELIEEMIRSELDAVLSRPRYGRRAAPAAGRQYLQLIGERVGEPPPALVGGKFLVPLRQHIQRVPADDHKLAPSLGFFIHQRVSWAFPGCFRNAVSAEKQVNENAETIEQSRTVEPTAAPT